MTLKEYLNETTISSHETNSATGKYFPGKEAENYCKEFVNTINNFYLKNKKHLDGLDFLKFIKKQTSLLSENIKNMLAIEARRLNPEKDWSKEDTWKK